MFELGQTVMTSQIANRLGKAFALNLLYRHATGDWGDLGEEDKALNEAALKNGDDRIFSMYRVDDERVYVITEWDHSVTTILYSYEY